MLGHRNTGHQTSEEPELVFIRGMQVVHFGSKPCRRPLGDDDMNGKLGSGRGQLGAYQRLGQ